MEIFGRIGYAVFCLSLSVYLSNSPSRSLSPPLLSLAVVFAYFRLIDDPRVAMSCVWLGFTCYLRFCAFRSPLQFHFKFASIIHHNFNDFYRFVSNLFSTKSKLPLPVYLIPCIDSASLFRFKGLIWVAKHAKHCKMVGYNTFVWKPTHIAVIEPKTLYRNGYNTRNTHRTPASNSIGMAVADTCGIAKACIVYSVYFRCLSRIVGDDGKQQRLKYTFERSNCSRSHTRSPVSLTLMFIHGVYSRHHRWWTANTNYGGVCCCGCVPELVECVEFKV